MTGIENIFKRGKPSALLGLALDGSRLDGVVLRRTNGSLHVQQTFSVTLSLDPLTAAPELVGREIRNHLDAAGVRERHCVVSVPLKWALTANMEVPKLPEEDIPNFLQLEAERGFLSDAATLHLATSCCKLSSGAQHATLLGIPKTQLTLLDQVLQAAKLKPVSFSPGITVLQPADAKSSNGVMALAIGESHVGLQITAGGGVAALRALEGAVEIEGSRKVLHADVVAREARITLGQLPAELRDAVRSVRIFGPRDLAQQLADEMELRLEAMGLEVEVVTVYAPNEFGVQLPPGTTVSRAFSLAARQLAGHPTLFEFLPPKVTQWQLWVDRYASGRYRTAGAIAAGVLSLLVIAFLYQQIQLMRYQSRWKQMSDKVTELDALQQKIQQFRLWYDDSLAGLNILRQLTSAFPEEGVVSAKSVEIRDLNIVTISGTARDNQSLLRMRERLASTSGVSDVKTEQIRGRAPIQFTFSFRWSEGGMNAN